MAGGGGDFPQIRELADLLQSESTTHAKKIGLTGSSRAYLTLNPLCFSFKHRFYYYSPSVLTGTWCAATLDSVSQRSSRNRWRRPLGMFILLLRLLLAKFGINWGSFKIWAFIFKRCLISPGIDSLPGGPVPEPYLSYRPARLHRLAKRLLGSLNVYKCGLWLAGTTTLFLLSSKAP